MNDSTVFVTLLLNNYRDINLHHPLVSTSNHPIIMYPDDLLPHENNNNSTTIYNNNNNNIVKMKKRLILQMTRRTALTRAHRTCVS